MTLSVLAAVGGGCAPARIELRHGKEIAKVRVIAVANFVDAPGKSGSGKVVVTAVTQQMYQFPGIGIKERQHLSALAKEDDLELLRQGNEGVARKLGRLAGANAVVVGEVMQYEDQQEYSHMAVHMVAGGGTKRVHRVGLSVRLVDVSTGLVIYSGLGQGSDREGYPKAAQTAAWKALEKLRLFYDQTHGKKG